MLNFIRSRQLRLAVFFTLALCATAAAQTIGSANTVTADPPVPRPHTQPCVVSLFSNFMFADFSGKPFTYTPPAACPGPWARVVLEADFSINAGRQFDRTANIWLGGVNVYFGTTAEPSHAVSRSWHVERDLTDYSALLTSSQNGEVDLGNLVNSTFTSILMGSADLQFYPLPESDDAHFLGLRHGHQERGEAPPRVADVVLPLSAGPNGGTVALNNTASQLTATFTLPLNIVQAYLDVVAQSQANDEFWYTCVPNDVAGELQSCGSTAFREAEISIDGTPAGVAPIYPWIYTGGIDPLLWRPIPGVQTLNFIPYRVDLSPFAGLLSNGVQHTLAVSVFNADNNFATTATLLLYLDHDSARTFGALTSNTLAAAPAPTVQENITSSSSLISGSVNTTSAREYKIRGWVRTSHGRVHNTVRASIGFSNQQQFNITATTFVQNIQQQTDIKTLSSHTGDDFSGSLTRFRWPLTLNFTFTVNPDGSGSQTTTIDQEYHQVQAAIGGGRDHGGEQRPFFSLVSNVVTPNDTLLFDSSGTITGSENQSNAQKYFTRDSTGRCYSRQITAASGVLTAVTDGIGCEP